MYLLVPIHLFFELAFLFFHLAILFPLIFLAQNVKHILQLHQFPFYLQLHKRNSYKNVEVLVLHLNIHVLYGNLYNTNIFLVDNILYKYLYHWFFLLMLLLLFQVLLLQLSFYIQNQAHMFLVLLYLIMDVFHYHSYNSIYLIQVFLQTIVAHMMGNLPSLKLLLYLHS